MYSGLVTTYRCCSIPDHSPGCWLGGLRGQPERSRGHKLLPELCLLRENAVNALTQLSWIDGSTVSPKHRQTRKIKMDWKSVRIWVLWSQLPWAQLPLEVPSRPLPSEPDFRSDRLLSTMLLFSFSFEMNESDTQSRQTQSWDSVLWLNLQFKMVLYLTTLQDSELKEVHRAHQCRWKPFLQSPEAVPRTAFPRDHLGCSITAALRNWKSESFRTKLGLKARRTGCLRKLQLFWYKRQVNQTGEPYEPRIGMTVLARFLASSKAPIPFPWSFLLARFDTIAATICEIQHPAQE